MQQASNKAETRLLPKSQSPTVVVLVVMTLHCL